MRKLSILLSFSLLGPQVLRGQSFEGLGTLDASLANTFSEPSGVSRDGGTIVGRWLPNSDINAAAAFLWRDGAMTRMRFPALARTEALDVSGDGLAVLIAGGAQGGATFFYRWTQTGGTKWIGEVGQGGRAHSISADGRFVVGTKEAPDLVQGGTIRTAFNWTVETGIQELGLGEAHGVSADGAVVVGSLIEKDSRGRSTTKPYAWRNGSGSVLADSTYGIATAVSDDGKTIIGAYSINQEGQIGVPRVNTYSFRDRGGLQILDSSTSGDPIFSPLAVSGDGSVIVGEKIFPGLGLKAWRAMIWTENEGLRAVEDVLTQEYALDLQGWYLGRATAISGDGRVIAGYGTNPKGLREAWRAVLIDPDPVRLTISTRESNYDPGKTFTATVTASLTRSEPHTIRFDHPLLKVDDPLILELGDRDPVLPVALTAEKPSASFSVAMTAGERGVAELSASGTAANLDGNLIPLRATKKIAVNPLELEVTVTPPNLVLNLTPQSKKSAECILLENGVGKKATNCIEIVATIRNASAFEVKTVGITFSEKVLSLIQSSIPTNPAVPLTPILFTPPAGLEANGEAKRVNLAPGETIVYRWNLDAFDAPASLNIKVRVTGSLKNTEVVAFRQKEFKLVDKVLLEWGIRPVEGRTHFLSGQPVRVQGFLKNVSKAGGEGKDLVALVYQLPEGNVGGGFMIPSAQAGATADRYFVFELPPEGPLSRIDIGSIFRSFHTYSPAKGKIRYGIRLWVREKDNSLTPATDQAILDDEWLDEFDVHFAADPAPPDGFREECLDAGVPAMICGLSHGIYFEGSEAVLGLMQFAATAGTELKNLGGMLLSHQAFLASRLWRTVQGDPAAFDALMQEAYVEYLTFVNLGVMAGEGGSKIPMAFEAFSISTFGAVDRFFRAVDEGDLEEVQFQIGKFFGANPDLLFEPLVVARNFQALTRSLKNLAEGATDNVIAKAEIQAAERQAASLDSRLAAAEADPNVTELATALRAGDQLTDNLLARIYGISSEQRRRLQDFAKRYDVIVSFRTRHPRSLELLTRKLAWPKPQALKWKCVNDIDVDFLGYRKDSLARIELVEPPAGLLAKTGDELESALDDYMTQLKREKPQLEGNTVLESEVRQRLKQRVEEWDKLSPTLDLKNEISTTKIEIDFDAGTQGVKGRKAGFTDSRTVTQTPVGAVTDPVTGAPRRTWELKMSGPGGTADRFVTGDVDFLAIFDRYGGMIRDENMRIKMYHELANIMDMQHGESFTFFLQSTRVEYLRCCVEGAGEAMVTIGPLGRSTPTAGYFVDNLSIFEDGPNTKFIGPRKHVLDPNGAPKLKDGKPIEIRRDDPTGEFMLITGMPSVASVKYGLIRHFLPLTFSQSIAGFLRRLPFYFPTYLARLLSNDSESGSSPLRAFSSGVGLASGASAPVAVSFHADGPILQGGAKGSGAALNTELQVWTREQGWKAVTAAQAIALGQSGVADIAPMTSVAGDADAGILTFEITSQAELETTGRFFQPGDQIVLSPGALNQEFAVIATVDPFTLSSAMAFHHERGDLIAFLRAGMKDTDADGLTDLEEESRGTLANDPDTDLDGFLDGSEVLLGTDPLDPSSILRVLSITHDSNSGAVTVLWSAVPGRSYTLEVRYGLESDTWSPVAAGVAQEAALAATLTHPEDAPKTARFYRIRLGE